MNNRLLAGILTCAIAFGVGFDFKVQAKEVKNLSAKQAKVKLVKGNKRFSQMHMKHPDETKARRLELLNAQHPFVAILSCSDSRVPSEIIFDQGIGDVFVIRNAGNILDDHVIGSIEYAVYHLGIKLVVVMAHQNCGAVKAAMEEVHETKYIDSLEEAINPVIEKCKKEGKYTYDNVVRENAKYVVSSLLEEDSKLNEYCKKHNVKIVPAYYSLDSGEVEFLD